MYLFAWLFFFFILLFFFPRKIILIDVNFNWTRFFFCVGENVGFHEFELQSLAIEKVELSDTRFIIFWFNW